MTSIKQCVKPHKLLICLFNQFLLSEKFGKFIFYQAGALTYLSFANKHAENLKRYLKIFLYTHTHMLLDFCMYIYVYVKHCLFYLRGIYVCLIFENKSILCRRPEKVLTINRKLCPLWLSIAVNLFAIFIFGNIKAFQLIPLIGKKCAECNSRDYLSRDFTTNERGESTGVD